MLQEILQRVDGTLPYDACRLLQLTAQEVPEEGRILDLHCGLGRSTISMATGLAAQGRKDVSIVAVDTHITDIFSHAPYDDGTLMRFVKNLLHFKVGHLVIPIIAPIEIAVDVMGKKSTNLVVVQAYGDSTLSSFLHAAQYVIRKGGRIAVSTVGVYDMLIYRALGRPESEREGLMIFEVD